MTQFKDHFSGLAQDYARFRPTYPENLFSWLAETAPARNHVWDCATGTGQAACALAAYFERVTATDASEKQLANAEQHPRVTYHAAPAEASGLPNHSVDLITAAQAIHWFHFDRFYDEVRRVAKPNALLAAWTYDFFRTTPQIDDIVDRYAHTILGPYWPPERAMVNAKYATLPFPFERIDSPLFTMKATWSRERVLGYLVTWSAYKNYRAEHKDNPMDQVYDELYAAWGDMDREVSWNLTMVAGKVKTEWVN
ncbi:MAG: class I SAM-dependent methyltransferase [Acidobacteriota bacterium]|nr:class I SAM-dependent methyltransferase [Acidobacteriota bacterium]